MICQSIYRLTYCMIYMYIYLILLILHVHRWFQSYCSSLLGIHVMFIDILLDEWYNIYTNMFIYICYYKYMASCLGIIPQHMWIFSITLVLAVSPCMSFHVHMAIYIWILITYVTWSRWYLVYTSFWIWEKWIAEWKMYCGSFLSCLDASADIYIY